jgi:hypothetical protein
VPTNFIPFGIAFPLVKCYFRHPPGEADFAMRSASARRA